MVRVSGALLQFLADLRFLTNAFCTLHHLHPLIHGTERALTLVRVFDTDGFKSLLEHWPFFWSETVYIDKKEAVEHSSFWSSALDNNHKVLIEYMMEAVVREVKRDNRAEMSKLPLDGMQQVRGAQTVRAALSRWSADSSAVTWFLHGGR